LASEDRSDQLNWSLRRSLKADMRRFWPLWLIVAAAIAMRLHGIGRMPGILGDEAWYGVQIQRFLEGTGGAWRTPTGNVPGIIHYGSLALLHSLFQPSALLLRIPALLSSLAAIALAYTIARRYFGAAAGMAALVLMACLPINIAYARLGWDPSHTQLLVLLATYAALADRRILSALFFAFALSNHPAAVFAAPFLTLAYFGIDIEHRPWRRAAARTAAYVALLALAILFSLSLSPGAGHYVDISRSIIRLGDLSAWSDFALLFGRLLSGETAYNFIVGQSLGPMRTAIDLIVLLVLAAILTAGLIALRRRLHWPTAAVTAGWLASLFLLFVVAGSWALRPSLERFSIALVPPTALALAALLGRCFPGGIHRGLFQALVAAMALPMLAGFWLFYLQPLDRGEGRPGTGLWTGLPALNQAALEAIIARTGAVHARVIAEDSWIYWPVTYRAAGQRLFIVNAGTGIVPMPRETLPGGTYWISYRGRALDRELSRREDVRLVRTLETTDRRHALKIWWQD
jgi:hypothetical protein